jgi:hypothetical protein
MPPSMNFTSSQLKKLKKIITTSKSKLKFGTIRSTIDVCRQLGIGPPEKHRLNLIYAVKVIKVSRIQDFLADSNNQ